MKALVVDIFTHHLNVHMAVNRRCIKWYSYIKSKRNVKIV